MKSSFRGYLLLLSVLASLTFGCGSAGKLPETGLVDSTPGASGRVKGGQQPVSGASIKLYAVGTSGDGSLSTSLLTSTVMTNASGVFTITGLYKCPTASSLVYLVALGGNPGLGTGKSNPNLSMMVVLGPCGSLTPSTFVQVNELTTVAAVYALQPYMKSYSAVGSTTSNSGSLAAAFNVASELVSITSGFPPGPNVPQGYTVPTSLIVTLGDIVAGCVNSAGGTAGDNSVCGKFFYFTAPVNGAAATDIVGALLNLAVQPAFNTVNIAALLAPNPPFQPTWPEAPPNFAIRLLPPTSLILSASSVSFPTMVVGGVPVNQSLTITNGGSFPVAFSSFAITGANASDFGYDSTCGSMLASGANCAVTLAYNPLSAGNSEAYFSVLSNDPASPSFVTLSGSATSNSAPISSPSILPTGVFVQQPTVVTFTATVPTANVTAGSVSLLRYDASHNFVGVVATMHDDGLNGDSHANDGLYTAELTLSESVEDPIFFRVSVSFSNSSQSTLSNESELVAVAPLTVDQVAPAFNIPQQAATFYQSAIASGLSVSTAQSQLITWLMEQPTVAQAASDGSDELGVAILYKSGLLGHITIGDSSIRGGATKGSTFGHMRSPYLVTHVARDSASTKAAQPSFINPSKTVLTLSPFHSTPAFQNSDEAWEEGGNIASASATSCYAVTRLTDVPQTSGGPTADVAAFKTLKNYGLVLIASHGDTWFQSNSFHSPSGNYPLLYPGFRDRGGERTVITTNGIPNDMQDQEAIANPIRSKDVLPTSSNTNSIYNPSNMMDAKAGRLILEFRYDLFHQLTPPFFRWAVTDLFINAYNKNSLPNIVYAGSCRSAANNSLSNALADVGTKDFFGYDAIVDGFAHSAGLALIDNLRAPKDADTAWQPFATQNACSYSNQCASNLGDPPAMLVHPVDGDSILATCPKPEFIFDDGEPGNISIQFNGKTFNYPGLQFGQTESLGFAELPLDNSVYKVVVAANGGFADITLNLPTGFLFSNGTQTDGAHVISFSGPVTFTFHGTGQPTTGSSSKSRVLVGHPNP